MLSAWIAVRPIPPRLQPIKNEKEKREIGLSGFLRYCHFPARRVKLHGAPLAGTRNPVMDVEFTDSDLERLELEHNFTGGHSPEAVRGFRKVIQAIRAATDERDLYALKSLHFEKLKGDRQHQRSLRLNKQWRLIVEIMDAKPKNKIVIIGIEDYH